MTEIEQLEQVIAALELQRGILGDAAVDTSLAALKEKLESLSARAKAEEQRKQVTVLFADISGFTAMTETMDAEDVTRMMNRLWERLDRVVLDHGGTIDKHIGDNVMAVWGMDRAQENDPERALCAALAMQERVKALQAEWRADRPLMIHIGVNTGPALLGRMGTTGEYTAMGDTVNTASRLEERAPSGGILISHDTYRHVQGVFDVTPLDPMEMKGKRDPMKVYLLLRKKPRSFRIPARGIEGIETHMIGREAELAALQDRFEATARGAGLQIVTIVGDAGIGKSRLLYEFNLWLDLQPQAVYFFKGRAAPETASSPYGLFKDLFSFRFNIRESDSTASMRRKFLEGVGGILPAQRAEVLGQFLGFDFTGSLAVRRLLGSPNFGKMAFADLALYFQALAKEPVVLFLEDIHWADEGSLDLLHQLVEALPEGRLMIVGLARPGLLERRPDWNPGGARHRRMDLRLLSDHECRALVTEILKKVPDLPERLRDLVAGNAEGNPYYVEELIKMLIEERVIIRSEGAWSVEADRMARVSVPPTLVGVLQARLDGLPREERLLLQKASVVGRTFWDTAVTRLDDGEGGGAPDADALMACLRSIMRRELIFPRTFSSFENASEYIFKHALLRDVTYETVLLKLRRIYHAQVARWLESNVRERKGEYLHLIAGHYELAGERENAADCLFSSGKEMLRISAFKDACDAFTKAFQLMPEARAADRVRILTDLGTALSLKGDYPEAKRAFARALDAAAPAGEAPESSGAENGLGRIAIALGDYDEALYYLDHALASAGLSGDKAGMASVLLNQADAHFRIGHAREARECAEAGLELSRELGNLQGVAGAHRVLGFASMMRGDLDAAEEHHRESGRIYGRVGDRWGVATGLINLGEIHRKRGHFEKAVACWTESLPIAEEIGAKLSIAIIHLNTGNVLALLAGREEEAWRNLRAALAESLKIGSPPLLLEGLVGLMHIRLRTGRPPGAAELVGLVTAHPSFNAEIKEYVGPILERLKEELPEPGLSEALARGAAMQLEEVVRRLLDDERR